ncbi:Uncharacterised protein [Serratia fonticola]|uniref:Uncharacterized protein n=1 Tax=Serratia fonticola TaxID=47917 RepID=A0A4U9WND5_SERFO|nr:Uncharacterised protein [Serratia fonticola]
MEAPGDDLFHQILRQSGITRCQPQRHHAHPVFIAFQIALAIEGFQRIAGVILEGAEEGLEAEFLGISLLEQLLDKGELILLQHRRFVISLIHQIAQFFRQVVEEHGVLVHVLQKVLPGGQPILIELDAPFGVVKVEHRVERMVIQRGAGGPGQFCRCQNAVTPC